MGKQSKPVDCKVYVEIVTLKDKPRRLSAPRPTEYIVQIHILRGANHTIVREWTFDRWREAKDHYTDMVWLLS